MKNLYVSRSLTASLRLLCTGGEGLFKSVKLIKFFKKIIFLVLFLFNISFLTTTVMAKELIENNKKVVREEVQKSNNNPYAKLAKYLLPSLVNLNQEQIINDKINAQKQTEQTNFNHISKLSDENLTEKEEFETLFRILSNACNIKDLTPEKILNNNVYNDTEIFCSNSTENTAANLLCKIDNTQTLIGKFYLAKLLFQPTTNIEILTKRQEIIKTLINDEKLFDELDKKLEQIKKNEQELIWFWKELKEKINQVLNTFIYQDPQSALKNLNKSPSFLNFSHFLGEFQYLVFLAMQIGIPIYGIIYPFQVFNNNPLESTTEKSVKILAVETYLALASIFAFPQIIKMLNGIRSIKTEIHEKMVSIAQYTNDLKDLTQIVFSNKNLKLQPSSINTLNNFFNNSDADNLETKKLLTNLNSGTFKESCFFSNKGKVLANFKIMQEQKDNFIDSFEVVGEIDAYLSIAKLYKKLSNNPNASYSFAEYEKKDKPYISLSNFWSPFLDPDTVIPNSIEIGDNNKDIVLTGPNAGGKSTILKGITTCLTLAQTIGMVPASKMQFTPFAKINTYLNITDTLGKESLYQAEMYRVSDLIKSINELKDGEFSFVIMDEIFIGTNPKEGEAAAYGIARRLASFEKNICILATHFKKLTDLQKDTNEIYKNYKVFVNKNSDGSFAYPYKLEKGISDQTIALDLLKLEGFDQDILDYSYQVLNANA